MKAAIISAPEAGPAYGDFDDPRLTKGQEMVDLVASGIHPVVRTLASGRHYGSRGGWPLIPGIDAVARTADDTLIYTGFVNPPYGTLAERMAVPTAMRFPLPKGADPVQIAAAVNPGLSSWLPLKARAGEIGALGRVLILGVTGVAGSIALQNALALGATSVVGAGRNPAGLERAAQLGAQTVMLTGDRDVDAHALTAAIGDLAPNVVLDYVWAGAAEAAFVALGKGGLEEDRADIAYVQIGAMGGPHAAVPASLLRSRCIRLFGSGAGSASISQVIAQIPEYMQRIADHEIDIATETFALSSIAEAWDAQPSGARRTVVVPG